VIGTFVSEMGAWNGISAAGEPARDEIGVRQEAVANLERELAELSLPSLKNGFAVVIGRHAFLADGKKAGIGVWAYDRVVGRRASFAPAGKGGTVHHGPYIELAPGLYELIFTYREESATEGMDGAIVGSVDITVNTDRVIAHAEIVCRGATLQTSRHIFEATAPDDNYEFRVHSNGTADIYLHAVTLQAIPNSRIGPRIRHELLQNARHDVGGWNWDAILKHVSWFVPAGSSGQLHSSFIPKLDPGTYEIKFVLRLTDDSTLSAGRVEVLTTTDQSIFSHNLLGLARRPHLLRHIFDVKMDADPIECRVFTTGIVGVHLYAVTLNEVADEPAARCERHLCGRVD
jgi:hypothetical protein